MSDHMGLLHIYYGDGKGKTTAAFGYDVVIRAIEKGADDGSAALNQF